MTLSADMLAQPTDVPTCPVCNVEQGSRVLSTVDGIALCSCLSCGAVYTFVAQASSVVSDCYPADYYTHRPAHNSAGQGGLLRSLVLHRFYGYDLPTASTSKSIDRLLAAAEAALLPLKGRWRTIPPAVRGGHLLDVGCGSGAYLARVKGLGWSIDGLEPDAAACTRASAMLGTAIVCSTIDISPWPAETFDVVTFWHSLEHMDWPVQVLQSAHDLLRRGGLIMLEVPNWDSAQRRLFGPRWFHLDLARHRLFFSADVLGRCLTRAGFVDIVVRSVPSTVGVTGSLESIFFSSQSRVGRVGWRHNSVAKASVWPVEAVLGEVGLAGCLFATGRKP